MQTRFLGWMLLVVLGLTTRLLAADAAAPDKAATSDDVKKSMTVGLSEPGGMPGGLDIPFDEDATAEVVDHEIVLFDGKTLDGWEAFLVDPKVKMTDVWSVADGILTCQGEPLGYLRTKKDYKDYHLVVEWRWKPDTKPGNSGVLMRMTGELDQFVPKCMEAQLWSGHAGDLSGFRGFNVTGPTDRAVDRTHPKLGRIVGAKLIKANEKEPGQWNRFDITLDGPHATVLVNGEKVNEATDCDDVAGKIGFQSEGGVIQFRTIKLEPVKK